MSTNTAYVATITTGAKGTNGSALPGSYSWQFSTVGTLTFILNNTTIDSGVTSYDGKNILVDNAVVTVAGGLHTFGSILVIGRGSLVLSGGTIQGCSITTTNGASFIVQGGSLNGVTVNGVLDVGSSYAEANLAVTNGLVLNGTALVGNPTNSNWGAIDFQGTQTLRGNGTVMFGNGNSYYNAVYLANGGNTLTVGSGITIEGQNGTIGYGSWWGGAQNVSIINQGVIAANVSGGTIVVNAQPLVNSGTVSMSNGGSLNITYMTNAVGLTASGGGTLTLNGNWQLNQTLAVNGSTLSFNGSWTNAGTINATNATVNLGGSFTVADVGTFNRIGGTVNLTGILTNSGTPLVLDANTTGSWVLDGGTILGGTILTTNGATLIVNGGGSLNGVTVNGVLDVGNSYAEANLAVTNGLVLNGTALVGNPTNSNWGAIDFQGTQTLSGNGTVVFGNQNPYYNAVYLANGGTTLTVGAGITIEGQNGTIGYGSWWGGAQNVSVINQGVIAANVSGGTIAINAQPLVNSGTVSMSNGGSLNINYMTNVVGLAVSGVGTLTLNGNWQLNQTLAVNGSTLIFNGSWTNAGTINLTNATVNLGGTFTVTNLGTINRNGGTVQLTGTLVNRGVLTLDAATGSWVLDGGTVQGGTLTATAPYGLIVQGGTLDGLTVNGVLDVGSTYAEANLAVVNGLVLNGTALVGNSTNNNWGAIDFQGSQTLSGNGAVVFGQNSPYWNAVYLANGGTTLTVGSGITIEGQNGTIGYGSWWGGAQNVSIINQGVIAANVSGGTIAINAQPLVNSGTVSMSNGGSLNINYMTNVVGLAASGSGALNLMVNGQVNQPLSVNGTTLILNGNWQMNQPLSINGGTLTLSGSWTNTGTINATNSTVNLGGSFTLANVGTFNRSGGTVNLTGTLTNTGTALVLDANTTGSWVLDGGTILGGTMFTTNGAACIVNGSGSLNGVTVNGTLDVGSSYAEANLAVVNGLVLNGTALVGNPTDNNWGAIDFQGTQTLSGNGAVVFGQNSPYWNAVYLANGGTTLTVGSGIIIEGQNGTIGYGSWWGGAQNVSVINQGVIAANVSGGTITINAQPLVNSGTVSMSNGGSLNINYMTNVVGLAASGSGALNLLVNGQVNQPLSVNGTTLTLSGSWTNTGTINATNSTVNLGGSFTLADVGTFNRSGGTVNLTGTLTNIGTALVLDANTSGSWVLDGGTILGGTIFTTNGAAFIVNGNGSLIGVTVNGTLDVGNTYNGAQLTVNNGLVLNGTALVGNPTNSWVGGINFAMTESLTGNGTVVFGIYSWNALWMANGGTTLTLGSGITVRGWNGTIGYSPNYFGGAQNVTVINLGKISADSGGTIYIYAQPFLNQGLAEGINGGTLNLASGFGNSGILNVAAGSALAFGGSWTNTGTISATNATVNLGGAFALTNLGSFNANGNVVNLTGALNNTNITWTLNGTTNLWRLYGGTINGGTVVTTNGASLVVNGSGMLNGVTVNGTLDVGNTYNGAQLTVNNGLVLNGTALVGNPTNSWVGGINFAMTESLTGNGTVVFGTYSWNALWMANGGTTLTLGSGITVRGWNGTIGYSPNYFGGAPNVAVINQGTISADGGGTLYLYAQSFTNQGTLNAPIGTLSLSGNYNLAGGVINVGISGLSSFGQINFAGDVSFAGAFGISLNNGYQPTLGNSFAVINYGSENGSFSSYNLPSSGLPLEVNYGGSILTVNAIQQPVPIVNIINPTNNTIFQGPANIQIIAVATSTSGTITNVDFFQGSNLLGRVLTSPYSLTWSNVPPGAYPLIATAADTTGAVGVSSVKTVIVLPTVQGTNFTWNGSVSSAWSTAGNWSPAGVPGPLDEANILNGGTVTISHNTTIGFINLGSGSINGAGSLLVENTFYWTAGSVNCPVTIQTNSVLIMAGSSTLALFAPLTNEGMVDWTGTGNLQVYNYPAFGYTGGIINQPGAVFNALNDQSILAAYGYEYFNNAGLFQKQPTTGTTTIGVLFTNTGVVNVESGIVSLNYGGSGNGQFVAEAGATLAFPNSYTAANGAAFIGAGTNLFSGGTFTANGSITTSNAVLAGATLAGNSSFGGLLTWTSGSIGAGGMVSIASNAVLNLSGSSTLALFGVLTNAGTVNWTSTGNLQIYNYPAFGYTGGIVNQVGAVFNARNDQSILPVYGYEYFNNAGLFQKQPTTGTTAINVNFTNTGIVNVGIGMVAVQSQFNGSGGVLSFPLNGINTYGRMTFGSPITLDTAGTLQANAGKGYSPSPGDGFTLLTYPAASGNFTNFELPPQTQWQAITNPTSFIIVATTFQQTTNTYTWTGAASYDWFNPTNWNPIGVPNGKAGQVLNFANGTLNLSSPLTIQGQFNWFGGVMTGSPLTIGENGELSIEGYATKYLQNILTNAGTLIWEGGNIVVSNCSAKVWPIVNAQGALWTIFCDETMSTSCANTNAYWENFGTVVKAAFTGTTAIGLPLDNIGGTIEAFEGTLVFSQPVFFNGATVSGPGTITLNDGLQVKQTLVVSGAEINLYGFWNNSGTIDATNAVLNLGGNFTRRNLGLLNTSGGVVNLIGTLNNTGATLSLGPATPWVVNGGTIDGGTVTMSNGGAILVGTAGATFNGPVTVDGLLDVGNSYSGATLALRGGLVLNGMALLGNPTNSWYGYINFIGTQSLTGNGTVVFGNNNSCAPYSYNSLRLDDDFMTLTIGSGITVRGQNGTIGYEPCLGGWQDVSLINQGTIQADVAGGTIAINAQPFSNEGLAQGINGGTLALFGTWENLGTLGENGGAINFGGDFALDDVGTLNQTNGAIYLSGILDNTGTTLMLSTSNSWILQGGTIFGGSINSTNGASFVVNSGTLDGVTVNGTMDVGNSYNGANLTVLDGLTLNGTALVGNPTNNWYGYLNLAGTQILGGNGTVVFGDNNSCAPNSYNSLRMVNDGTTLTIGPGVTIRGQNGTIGYEPCFGGPNDGSVINQGTIQADETNGTITINAQPFSNEGLAQGINGGTLWLFGIWENIGTFVESGGAINFGGDFVLDDVGTLNQTSGLIYVSGTLDNTGTSLMLNTNNFWVLQGGTILGGNINSTKGASFVVNSGTLDGVTVNGILDVGNSYNGANATVLDGLTLNGTALVGNPTNSWFGHLDFAGTQTLGGNGTVVFGNNSSCSPNSYNSLRLIDDSTILTIGVGITVRGQNGTIGFEPCFGGPQDVSVLNQGTIAAGVSGGTISINAQTLADSGNLEVLAGSTLNATAPLALNNPTALITQPGGTLQVGGDLLGNTRNVSQFKPQGTVLFTSGSHYLEAMSQDLGNVPKGYVNNFAYGAISLASGAQVTLVDQFTNSQEPPSECVYTTSLIVSSGSTLNLNGLHLYCELLQNDGTIANGTISQVPDLGGPLTVGNGAAGSISAAGALDEFTFLGRAGEQVAISVGTGAAYVPSPAINYALVKLIDPLTNVIGQASNTVAGQLVGLTGMTLPQDGTYTVAVQAPANQSASSGNYLVTVWDTTPTIATMVANQTEYGHITSPFSIEEWNFSASAGDQVQFQLLNEQSPAVAFILSGPNGWVGFSNLLASSGLVTLPYSGDYTLTAFGTGGAFGFAYNFEMAQTAQTNLAIGANFTGSFVGNGQAQLFAITVTNGTPLLINLNNTGANNVTEIYGQLGSPPTRTTYSYSSTIPNSSNQHLLIPIASAGVYYILVYGNQISTPGSYTLQVLGGTVFLTSVTPTVGPANSALTLTLTGSGFLTPRWQPLTVGPPLQSTAVALLAPDGTAYPAGSVTVDSFNQLTAGFNSNTLPVGVYSVQVTLAGGASALLTNTFQVLSGGAANFTSSLTVPGAIEQGSPATAYAQYANTGNATMPAPLMVLTVQRMNGIQQAYLGLDSSVLVQGVWTSAQQPLGFGPDVQFLAAGQVPGLLQPGESKNLPVYWAGWSGSLPAHSELQWNMGYVQADDQTALDWSTVESAMQPSTIPSDAWAAIFSAFTNGVVSTWGGYVTMLDNDASYLGQLGINVQDVTRLLAFHLLQADGLCPLRNLASSVDASVPAPGLPLVFSRSYGERIAQRYAMGPLGRGWAHNWQYSLQVASDGTVTIFGPGGSQRVFQQDKRPLVPGRYQPQFVAVGYFAQPGDHGVLFKGYVGTFTLIEKTGLQYFFQADGSVGYVQDPNKNRITFAYSGGRLTSLTHSSGQSIQLGYNAAGLVQTVADPFGRQTVLAYDAANQHLVSSQYFDGRTTTYTYNTAGAPTALHALTSIKTAGVTRNLQYDDAGRLAQMDLGKLPGPGGNGVSVDPIRFSYGSGGEVTVMDPLGNATQFYYDNRGLLAKTVNAQGNACHFIFDNNYNLVSVVDPTGRAYNYGYDDEGNVMSSSDPMANVTQFAFTPTFNRLASVTDARGSATRYNYDNSGNLLGITYADGSSEKWTYGLDGDPRTWNNRRGHQISFSYSGSGQLTSKQFADGSTAYYKYDNEENLTNASTVDSDLNLLESSTMSYDASNRLVQMSYPGGKYLTFGYDLYGRRSSSVDQLGHQLRYNYDSEGRLLNISNELNALVVSYAYDGNGRVLTKTLGNGLLSTYQYDPAGELLCLTNGLATGSVLSSFNYTYDSRGRRTQMSTLDGNWAYQYDDIGQLVHATYTAITTNVPNQDLTYIYDAVGNRVKTVENGMSTPYNANNLNQYVTIGQTNYAFDADANLVSEVSPAGTITYTYNDENRLVAMTSPQGSWQYAYDAFGSHTVTTANGSSTRDVIDPVGLGNVVGEYDTIGNLIAHYDYGIGLLARVDSSDNWAGYAFDGIGNVQHMVSLIGEIDNDYRYGPYGYVIRSSAKWPNPFQFNGQFGVMTDNNGLNFMRYRFYSPGIGRFESRDPLGLAGADINLNRFVQNNPISFIDPTGTASSEPYWWYWKWISRQTWLYRVGDTGRFIINESGARNLVPYAGDLPYISTWGSFFEGLPVYMWIWENVFEGTTAGPSDDEVPATDSSNQGDDEDPYQGPPLDFIVGNGGNFPGGYDPSLPGYPPPNYPNPCLTGDCRSGGSGTDRFLVNGDPNQLTGPAGFGIQNFVVQSNLFNYEIFFENESNATAPVQIVQINNPLPAGLDWATFELTEVAFGDVFIAIPPNTQIYETNLPFEYDGVNFQVQIEAGINLANGQVFANFYSIDALTGLPPEAGVGFLPPEDGTGRGMGQVSYSIRPTLGLPEGTQIPNVAYIRFDENPIVATDQVNDEDPSQGVDTNKMAIVTIDNSTPASAVANLPQYETNANFSVCWSGTDNGPGIASYDIYVSTNRGPWSIWLAGTSDTCTTFTGQNGNTYGFYSQARDNVGNLEPAHTNADATTEVSVQGITVVGPPVLRITMAGNQVMLAWPTNAGKYLLQTTTNLSQLAHWTTVTNSPAVNGTADSVTVPITNTNQFFRLQSL